MKNSKKILVLVLSLVLVCSMLFGLVACNNEPQDEYVTIVVRDSLDEAKTLESVKVKITGKGSDYTVGDILVDATREDLGLNISSYEYTKEMGVYLTGIGANKLALKNDNKNANYIMFYLSVPEKEGATESLKIGDVKFYQASVGVSSIKVKAGETYLFNYEHLVW